MSGIVSDTNGRVIRISPCTGEVIDFHCRPTLKGLLTQLTKLANSFPGCSIRICYEASYCGYTLQQDLMAPGIPCEIVAPSSIPSLRGKAVKTDRLDAGDLAPFYANGLVTIVHPPDVV